MTDWRKSGAWIGTVTMVAAAAVVVVAPAAGAGHDKLPRQDNNDHYVDQHSLAAGLGKLSFDWATCATGSSVLCTEVNVWFTGHPADDVHSYDSNYGDTGWHGLTTCNGVGWTTPWLCTDWTIKFNEFQGKTADQWKSLGCHEFGHTVGLGHRSAGDDSDNNSCMRVEIWPLDYDNHDSVTIG